jgi:hypothetical protein
MKRIEVAGGVVYVRRCRLLSLALFATAAGLLAGALALDVAEEGRGATAAAAGLLTLGALIALAEQRAVAIDARRHAVLLLERHPFRRIERRVWPLDALSVRLETRAPGGAQFERVWILVRGEAPVLFARRWRRSARSLGDRLAADLGRPLEP